MNPNLINPSKWDKRVRKDVGGEVEPKRDHLQQGNQCMLEDVGRKGEPKRDQLHHWDERVREDA